VVPGCQRQQAAAGGQRTNTNGGIVHGFDQIAFIVYQTDCVLIINTEIFEAVRIIWPHKCENFL
jgi:hypothetical protein